MSGYKIIVSKDAIDKAAKFVRNKHELGKDIHKIVAFFQLEFDCKVLYSYQGKNVLKFKTAQEATAWALKWG